MHINIIVKANIPPDFHYHHRIGRRWSRDPVALEVVDAPASEAQITLAQLAELRADPQMFVEEVQQ